MRFSVVIPVYNTEKFLPRCLESLRAQTDQDYEVVVVDDCSPGGCADAVKPFGPSVRYVRHAKNLSAFQARLTGFRAACGDYVVPVDPDDYLQPDLLSRVRALVDRDRPDAVSYWMDYDDGRKTSSHWCRHPAGIVSGVEALRELAEHKFSTGLASKVIRRKTLLDAVQALSAPKDIYVNTCDDLLVLLPLLVLSERVAFLDYAGYRYFVNTASTSFSWQTTDGFRRACEQVRIASDLAARATSSLTDDESARAAVRAVLDDIERMFVRKAVSGSCSQDDFAVRADVLLACLHHENVVRELAELLCALQRSRAYRFGNAVAQAPRAVRSFVARLLGR